MFDSYKERSAGQPYIRGRSWVTIHLRNAASGIGNLPVRIEFFLSSGVKATQLSRWRAPLYAFGA